MLKVVRYIFLKLKLFGNVFCVEKFHFPQKIQGGKEDEIEGVFMGMKSKLMFTGKTWQSSIAALPLVERRSIVRHRSIQEVNQ